MTSSTIIDEVDYGPLAGLAGTWEGDKGMDVAPEPVGQEQSPYYESLLFEAIGDVTNAESQTLAVLRYHQVVRRKSDGQVFHNETGYWMWDRDSELVMQSLTIPRGVCLLAGGKADVADDGSVVIDVEAGVGNQDWSISQSPFMQQNARTVAFQHRLTLNVDELIYSETTMLEIYGRDFEHTDANTLKRVQPLVLSPIIADNKPRQVELKQGEEYYFCTCGRSANQPFCDGSHKGSAFKPMAFTADKDGPAYLCACKHTANAPFCDGTHKQFSVDQVGKPGPGPEAKSGEAPVVTATPEEPTVALIHQLAKEGLSKLGSHGPMTAMGVQRNQLPHWDDIQIMVAQLATKPLLEDQAVGTEVVIGPQAQKPLRLRIPLFVSDMSFGSLSAEAKIALAKGAEAVGTGICSGEGGMLPEEQQNNSRYFYELASAKFGYSEAVLAKVQAFHFKGGQGAKTGVGGHLPGHKNVGKVARVRGLVEGQAAISPPTFTDMSSVQDFKLFADRVREVSGGIPVGFKLSANHIERDMQFALDAGADYIILDGRGGSTGAAPELFRDHISVPTIPALARARCFLDEAGMSGKVSLIITGGLRMPADFVKALALGADAIAIANSALQAVGCVAARMCHTNNCPAGIATQKPELRQRLDVEQSAQQLSNFLNAVVELMQVMARACGHSHLNQFNRDDLATWQWQMAQLSGVRFVGSQQVAWME